MGQDRPNLDGFALDLHVLNDAMMDYITPKIIQQHCDFTYQTGDPTLDIHSNFDFQVIQKRSNDHKVVGGETYHILAPTRDGFEADAGEDKEISEGEEVLLEANDIEEEAI